MNTFFKRLLSTIILLGIFAGIVFGNQMLSSVLFGILACAFSFFAVWETCTMLEKAGKPTYRVLTSSLMAAGELLFLLLFFGDMLGIDFKIGRIPVPLAAMTAFVFGAFMLPWILLLFSKNLPENAGKILTGSGVLVLFAFPVFCMTFLFISYEWLLIYFVLVTKSGDIGAYAVGSLTNRIMKGGNHKMVPKISPGKSWEGAFGGLITAVICSILLFPYSGFGRGGAAAAVVLGVLLFLSGAWGDLAESSLKRACGVKDSGNTIPGIGGVFDLVDSLMLASPVFTFTYIILN